MLTRRGQQRASGEALCPQGRLAEAAFPNPLPKGTIVNKLNFNLIALAVRLAFSAGAMAQNLSQSD